MVRYAFVACAGLAVALPLNINLGAYSPALVVGDGEISFGGRQDVSNLITALEGAAVNAAAGAANAAAANNGETNAAAASPVPSGVPNTVENAATDPALAEQAQQIANLQGLGKAIAPRIGGSGTDKLGKRDLAGFDRALTYAEAALTKGPKIQLGTGAEGSGVGIIVDNTPAAAAGGGEQAGAAAKKRDVEGSTAAAPRRRAKVTTMFVRRGIFAALQSPRSEDSAAQAAAIAARAPAAGSSGPAATAAAAAAAAKRDSTSGGSSSAFDAVNLNVDGNAGVTMTFVEEVDGDDDDD